MQLEMGSTTVPLASIALAAEAVASSRGPADWLRSQNPAGGNWVGRAFSAGQLVAS